MLLNLHFLLYIAMFYSYDFAPNISEDDAIKELNYRFKEHGVGYQYESGKIIRIDSR